jgi:hypothetical protein
VVLVTAALVTGAAAAPTGVGNAPTGVPPGGGPRYNGSLTRIVNPSTGELVVNGELAVAIDSRASRQSLRVQLNGRSIAARLTRTGRGSYEALLHAGGALHPGDDLLTVSTTWGGQFDFDQASFVVARRVSGLVGAQPPGLAVGGAPITVAIRVQPGATLRAWLNERPVAAVFQGTGSNLVGQFGAADGVRHGTNRLVIVAYTASGRAARATTMLRHFQIPGDALIASAGTDRAVARGQFVRLNGGQSLLASGYVGRSFAWRIVQAPRGSRAKLRNSSSGQPGLIPDVPGTYRIRLTLQARPGPGARRQGRGPASIRSADTVIVDAQPSNPYGVSLESNATNGAIMLGGAAVEGTTRPNPDSTISYAVLNRTTLERQASGVITTLDPGLDELLTIAKRYSDGGSLMIFNWTGPLYSPNTFDIRGKLAAVVKQLGGGDLPAGDNFTQYNLPGSVIGVPGAPTGSAFFDHRDLANLPDTGDMSGYLRLNAVTGLFDFVFTDYVPVDTAASQTDTTTTITVGAASYPSGYHAPGASGFQLLRLDPKTLAPLANFTINTNAPDGSPDDQNRLANDLEFSANELDRPLVILQSYGKPSGSSPDWDRAARAIQKLGGTRQVFDDLNQPDLAGADPEQGRTGGYAFIGRIGSTAPRAEVSYPLDGLPARLRGLLMRSRYDDWDPSLVNPPRENGAPPVNEELVRIVNQAPEAFPRLARDASAAEIQAAQNFLGGPEVMGVCQAGVACDVRQTYYTNYNGSWQTIAIALQNATTKCQQPHQGLTAAVCEEVRSHLFDEVQAANRVRHYLGPDGLQQPFGAAGVAALANIGEISDSIQRAVNPPPGDNTASHALTITSYATKILSLGGPQAAAVAGGIGAVFGLAGYLMRRDNGPNLVGPQVQTAASHLGVELATRYQTAGDQLDGIGRIIVSDYGKLNAVASKVDSDPNWVLGAPGNARDGLIRAAKQTIAEILIPKAFPVLYDLGAPYPRNARNWNCFYDVPFSTRHKYLFADEPDGGQVTERFPDTNWYPTMAIGAVNAVDHQSDARIPTPPGSVMDPLFQPPALGGLGLKKLEFFTPRLFRLLPSEPGANVPQTQSLAFSTTTALNCGTFPDPPGNSG